jgi:hypothetical protein
MAADDDLNCRKASRLLSRACERPLNATELRALKRHLDACLMCRNFSTQLDFMRKAARRYSRGD